jgi:hypothetical protein
MGDGMKKFYEQILVILWIVLTTLFLSILFLIWYPYKPLEIDSFTVDRTYTCRGGELCYTITGTKNYNMPTDVTIELIDGVSVAIMSYTANMPAGKIVRKRCFNIPYHVQKGKYRVNWTGVYVMNSLNHVRVRAQSEIVDIR